MTDTPSQAAARRSAYYQVWSEAYGSAESRYDGPIPRWIMRSMKDRATKAGQDAADAEGEKAALVAQVHDAMPDLRAELRKVRGGVT